MVSGDEQQERKPYAVQYIYTLEAHTQEVRYTDEHQAASDTFLHTWILPTYFGSIALFY